MDLIINNLRIEVEKDGTYEYINQVKLRFSLEDFKFKKILSKSLDARNKQQFFYELSIVIEVSEDFKNINNFPLYKEDLIIIKKTTKNDNAIVIGFGPAGIFAALRLIDYGIKPLIFERGKKVEDRITDVKNFINNKILNTESNIQFGEGGAGTFSDGKLFSRIKNSTYANMVLDTFIKFGAQKEIAYINKPHVGTDVLCEVVKNMRNYILGNGGEINYSSKMTDIIISDGKATGVVINKDKEYYSNKIYLAVGHSSRDTFEILNKKNINIEQKPIAVGVRIEHPANVINLLRYGNKYKDYSPVGAATYSFTHTDRKIDRGIYTFCMCPGGEVVNAASEEGMLAINGMSNSKRSGEFSNSAIVVTCKTSDYGSSSPLAGVEFQKNIEKAAFEFGGKYYLAPSQNLIDFMSGKVSTNLNKNSFKMGTKSIDMAKIFPKFIIESLLLAFNKWKEEYPLFISEHAILIAPETRTSCPVKITRNESYESINIKNLYPIGEGSGYAGGITSSAVDAIKAVDSNIVLE